MDNGRRHPRDPMTVKVVHYVDTTTYGGLETMLATILEHHDRSRFDLLLACAPEAGLKPLHDAARRADVRILPVPRMGRTSGRAWARFVVALRKERPAIFHAHLNWPLACHYGIAAAAAAGVQSICATEHAFVEIPWRFSIAVERALSHVVRRYVAVSRAVADRLMATFRLPEAKLRVVYNGVAADRFSRPPDLRLRADLAAPGHAVVLALGRLDRQKGQTYLLDAIAGIPDATLVLAGEGPERARLELRAQKLGLERRVRLLGNRSDVPALLAACDVLVQPSASFEGCPLAVLEAMAAGRPVVATDVGGVGEVVLHGRTGLLVAPCSAPALTGALTQVLGDPRLAERLGAAGHDRAIAEFSVDRMMERLSAVYQDLAEGRCGGAVGR
jgi:glycosyltransferase involved in cell wall biosynthesis